MAAGREEEYSTIPSPAASILAASSASHPHITQHTYTWIVTQALTRLGVFTVLLKLDVCVGIYVRGHMNTFSVGLIYAECVSLQSCINPASVLNFVFTNFTL